MSSGTRARALGRRTIGVHRFHSAIIWAVVGCVALVMGYAGCGKTPGLTGPGSPEAVDSAQGKISSNVQPDIVTQTVDSLVRRGWSEKPARVVAQLNRRLMEVQWETDRSEWQKVVDLWGRLGTRPHLQEVVERIPEFAGVFVGALEAQNDAADLIAQSIPDDSQSREIVSNLYALFMDPTDLVMLAKALQRDRDLILRLCRHGGQPALGWLLKTPQADEAALVYRQWVRQVLEQALDNSPVYGEDQAITQALTLLDVHAPVVSELLQEDQLFRQKFLETYWPRFCRVLDILAQAKDDGEQGVQWLHYWSPRVWRYYHDLRDKGDDAYHVFERYGVIAVDLMLAPEYRELRDEVFGVLRDADNVILVGLTDPQLRSEPLFRELVRRKLPGWAVAKATELLLAKPGEAPSRLRYWQSLSDKALLEELGPPVEGPKTWLPGYGLYYVSKKVVQGRDVEGLDYIWALADVATLVSVAKASFSSSLVKTAARKGVDKTVVISTQKTLAKAGTRAVAPLIIKEAHLATRQKIATALASKSLAAVDVTDAVRWSFGRFQSLGLGRKTFEVLSKSEARVFMRADRRVVLDVGKLFGKNSAFAIVMGETAVNAGFDLAMNTQPGEVVAKMGADAVTQASKQLEAWRQHLSVWWTAVYTGAVDRALENSSKTGAIEPAR